jgi:iron complex outermembrane receptor protein
MTRPPTCLHGLPLFFGSWKRVSESSFVQARKLCAPAWKLGVFLSLMLMGHCPSGLAQSPNVKAEYNFNIPSQPVDTALTEFAEQADLTLVFPDQLVREKWANELIGRFSLQEGIDILLAGTGLQASFSSEIAMSIFAEENLANEEQGMANTSRHSIFKRLGLAMIAAFPAIAAAQSEDRERTPRTEIEEVIVTATKREETVRDVAMTVTAFSGAQLADMGAVNFDDYAMKVPGLGFSSPGPVAYRGYGPAMNIRGIGGTGAEPTTGFYIDETPLVSQNIKLYDINRVEILNGPQGTLYGARSYGGLVKVVTNKARADIFEANGSLGISSTERGGLNWETNAMVNIPLSDEFALRAVAYYVDNGGYIDSVPITNAFGGVDLDNIKRDTNDEETKGGRLSLNWTPSDFFDGQVNVLYEDQFASNVFVLDTWLQDNYGINGVLQGQTEPTGNTIRNYNLTLNFHTSVADITSSTSYSDLDAFNIEDRTAFGNIFMALVTDPAGLVPGIEGAIAAGLLPPGTTIATPLPILDFFSIGYNSTDTANKAFTQEVRMVSTGDGPLQWLTGAYYQDRSSDVLFYGEIPGIVAAGTLQLDIPGFGLVPFPLFNSNIIINRMSGNDTEELGLFGEMDYAFADNWEATVGLRWFDTDYSQGLEDLSTSLFVPTILPPSHFEISEDGFNPKFGLSYRPTDNALLFATASKGFRIGGVTDTGGSTATASCESTLNAFGIERGEGLPYDSDSLWTYELGAKTAWADNRVLLDATLYYNDWSDLQQAIFLPVCGIGIFQNAGKAESKGLEINLAAVLTEGLTLGTAFAFMDSEITESDALGLPVGTQLTLAPEFKGAVNLTYERPLSMDAGRWSFFGRMDYTYQDDALFDFNNSLSSTQPSFHTLGLRAGLTSERWDIIAFADNVTDEDAMLFDLTLVNGFVIPLGTDNRRIRPLRPPTYGVTFTVRY